MGRFEARTSAEAGRITVALAGECDLSAWEHLTAILLDAVRRERVVRVYMTRLAFIDSSGVHRLDAAHHVAKRSGACVCVVDAAGPVADVLELTGLDTLLVAPASSVEPASFAASASFVASASSVASASFVASASSVAPASFVALTSSVAPASSVASASLVASADEDRYA
ncbi:STAS domain-containing protein [Actinoplanes rectilineatus]|uniref:STAS domain-containing protein n=1 Tax=Actinoplanes rectilineatus TaxID=113571 RepID=UPI0012F9A332|nr:STAS domain-containing protein [Actinoplanes rectilineatus]